MTHHVPFRLCLPIAVLLTLAACTGDTAPANVSKPASTATQPDANGDGVISPAELVAFREAQRQEQMLKQAERLLARMDADQDGKVSVAEFSAAPNTRIVEASPEVAAQREQRSAMIAERIAARRAQMQADAEAAKQSEASTK